MVINSYMCNDIRYFSQGKCYYYLIKDYSNWAAEQPSNKSSQTCVYMDASGKWSNEQCAVPYGFLCQSGQKSGFYSM